MHFLLDSEASKLLWLALMKKSCFRLPFWVLLRSKPFITLPAKGEKMFPSFAKLALGFERRGAFDGFQTRILFISVSSSSLPEPISVDDEESARSPRWKVLVCWHSSSFILSRRERKLFHFLLPFHSLGPRVAEFSPEMFVSAHHLPSRACRPPAPVRHKVYWFPTPCTRAASPCTHCVRALMGILLHIWLSRRSASAIRLRQTGIAARRREKSKALNITVNVW